MENKQSPTIKIELAPNLKRHVQKQIEDGGYTNPSEYIGDLIRHDLQRQAAVEELGGLIVEGLRSGPPIGLTPEYWKEKERRLFKKPQKRKTA